MANWSPVSGQVLHYVKTAADSGGPASGYFLKFYDTSNVAINMASASDGSGLLAKCSIDSSGYPLNGSSARFIPFLDRDYRPALYTNTTDADADTIANADWFPGTTPLVVIHSATAFSKNFATLAAAVADTSIADGDALNLAERTTGNGGGAMWDAVLSSTVTENTFNIVQCTGVGTLSLVLRVEGIADVKQFGAVGDWNGSTGTDDTSAIQTALNTAKRVLLPASKYKVTATLTVPSGTELYGGGRSADASTVCSIHAIHTGVAILSLKGSLHVRLHNFEMTSDITTHPKTGLLLGRDASASAGHHNINFIKIQGYFSVALIYSIASEVNYFDDIYCWLLGGAAIHNVYTSEQDDFSVDSLVKSTNVQGTFKQAYLLNASTDNDSSCFYCEMGPNTGDWNFDGYLIPTGGSYARLSTKVANFPEAPGVQPFVPGSMTFRFGGEVLGGLGGSSNPLFGIRLTTDTAVKLKNFGINHTRMEFKAGIDKALLHIDSSYILETPNVVMGPPEASLFATVSFNPTKILGGIYSVDRLSIYDDITFSTNWNDTASATYGTAAISIDGFRNVRLRGLVKATAGGISVATINAAGTGYTAADVLTVSGGGANATITVNTVDGSGLVLTSTILFHGTGYTGASGVATTGGTGSGATYDTTTPAVGTTTIISVLPYGPAFDQIINCSVGSSGVFEFARLLVETDGTLSLNVGTTTKEVDLSLVTFRL